MSKARGFLSFLLLLAAMVALAATLAVCSYAAKASPLIIGESGDPGVRAEEFMEHVLSGRYEQAEALLVPDSSLGLSSAPTDPVGALLYAALQDSFGFEPCGSPVVSGTEASMEFLVTYLDLPSITGAQQPLTEAGLALRLEQAQRAEDVQNEDGSYREDVAMEVLEQVTAQLLENAGESYVQTKLSIKLIYSGDQWLVVPDAALFRILSGNTAY